MECATTVFTKKPDQDKIRLLLATSNISDVTASRSVLKSSAIQFDIDVATDAHAMLKKLHTKPFDVLMLDPGIISGDGFSLPEIIEAAGPDASTVLLVRAQGVRLPENVSDLSGAAMLSADTLRSEALPERIEECIAAASAARQGQVDAVLLPVAGATAPLFAPGSDRAYRIIIETLQEGIITVDSTGAILFTNNRVGDILGCDPDRLLGLNIGELIDADDAVLLETKMEEALRGSSARCELEISFPGAEPIAAMLSLHRIGDVGGSEGISIAIIDLSEEKRLRDELERLSITDSLTRLYNRRQLDRSLQTEWQRAARYARSLSCLMIDIDDFKQVNDKYGHLAGDEILRQVAARIQNAVRETDFVARYGGEEFCVLLPETTIEGAFDLAVRIGAIIGAKPIDVGGRPLHITVSVGVGDFDRNDDAHAETLISRSDSALQMAKENGKNCVRAVRS
jgi:diguanylate cyclase (GGDEF)-like protein/PAS domain S-box-containing protein